MTGKLLRLGKYAAIIVTLSLWAEEAAEAVTSLRGINPRLDAFLGSLTITLSVIVIAWICTDHIVKAQERKTAVLARICDAASEHAGLTEAGRVLRAVGSRKG